MNQTPKSIVNISGLCRVCGSSGSYSIFAKIPNFLHMDKKEQWNKDICQMISECTGLSITKNDGLPESICALCISYLRHAYLFRNQVIQTRLSLLSCTYLTLRDKLDVSDDEDTGPRVAKRGTETKPSAKNLAQQTPTTTTMPLEAMPEKLQRILDYKEKVFVEDDVTQLEDMDGVEIIHPEVFIERKCGFCAERFMLEETYEQHLDDCIYRTLIEFLADSNYLMQLLEKRSISNHEFVRRLVFSVRKINNGVCQSYQPSLEMPPDIIQRPAVLPGRATTSSGLKVINKFKSIFHSPIIKQQMPKCDKMDPGKDNATVYKRELDFFPVRKFDSVAKHPSVNDPSGESIMQSTSTTNGCNSDSKRVRCSKCDKTFLTISHLDEHILKHKI